MRILKTKGVSRFTRRERITDPSLSEAIDRANRGTIDADLGGGLIKQRVARPGQGRSGGFRMIIAYRAAGRAVFLYAFAKNDRDNIGNDDWLAASAEVIGQALTDGDLQEITHDHDE